MTIKQGSYKDIKCGYFSVADLQLPGINPYEETMVVEPDDYNGAHIYRMATVRQGWEDDVLEYDKKRPNTILFYHKATDGEHFEGNTDEQIITVLLDRMEKLDKKFSSPINEDIIQMYRFILELMFSSRVQRSNDGKLGKLEQ